MEVKSCLVKFQHWQIFVCPHARNRTWIMSHTGAKRIHTHTCTQTHTHATGVHRSPKVRLYPALVELWLSHRASESILRELSWPCLTSLLSITVKRKKGKKVVLSVVLLFFFKKLYHSLMKWPALTSDMVNCLHPFFCHTVSQKEHRKLFKQSFAALKRGWLQHAWCSFCQKLTSYVKMRIIPSFTNKSLRKVRWMKVGLPTFEPVMHQ